MSYLVIVHINILNDNATEIKPFFGDVSFVGGVSVKDTLKGAGLSAVTNLAYIPIDLNIATITYHYYSDMSTI